MEEKDLTGAGKRSSGVFVVGMKLSPECRERLTWIVAKLAMPGDHVIAIHILQPSSSVSSELDPATKAELDETFQGVLGVYQGLCTLKQIKLDIKVVVGASVKEALVDAAKLEDATRLILGTSKFLPTGLSTSLAKYCLKKLPDSCAVTIIDRGKVIFEKTGYRSSNSAGNVVTCAPSVIPRSMRKLNCSSSSGSSSGSSQQRQSSLPSPPSKSNVLPSSLFSESPDMYRSFPASPVSVLASTADRQTADMQSSTASSADEFDRPPSPKHGWPLRAFPLSRITCCSSPSRSITSAEIASERELSVVNWALQIPNRSRHDHDQIHPVKVSTDISQQQQQVTDMHTKTSEKLSDTLQALCYKHRASTIKFVLEELTKATSNFSSDNLVGRGGCSKVFRGVLSTGQTVAVKCLTPDSEQELITEVEVLSSLRHRSVVSLLGYCITGQSRMLVYNFADNGSLEQVLHGENSRGFLLDWPSRQKIALAVVQALEYLHDGWPRPVIHRDVKSSNILLTSSFDALLSDFGLAKWAPTAAAAHVICTDVVGTFGYLAPEYFMFGKLNEKTDVYSFGVVLLELITGQHPIRGQQNLVIWGRPLLEAGNVDKLIDSRLKSSYDLQEVKQMIFAAALCLRQSPHSRPRMRRISRLLSGEEEPPVKGLNQESSFVDEFQSGCDLRTHMTIAMAGMEDDFDS